jgi:myo-inositol-1(or 4)-monophosphatase
MLTETQAAVAAAREAGALLHEAFGQPLQKTTKRTTIDLVTEMDRAAETIIVESLRAVFPDYGFLTEESPAVAGSTNARWIIDPLDGTTNYAHGYPVFGVSIGLERAGAIVAGVIYVPMADELFVAEKGQGATLNGRPIRVSGTAVLGESLLTSGFPYDVRENDDDNSAEWRRFLKRVASLRCSGSTAVDLCAVACGRVDGYWEPGLSPWDVAAGALIVAEAGGRVTDYRGGEDFVFGRQIIAANPHVHAEMLAVVQVCGEG